MAGKRSGVRCRCGSAGDGRHRGRARAAARREASERLGGGASGGAARVNGSSAEQTAREAPRRGGGARQHRSPCCCVSSRLAWRSSRPPGRRTRRSARRCAGTCGRSWRSAPGRRRCVVVVVLSFLRPLPRKEGGAGDGCAAGTGGCSLSTGYFQECAGDGYGTAGSGAVRGY